VRVCLGEGGRCVAVAAAAEEGLGIETWDWGQARSDLEVAVLSKT
jgi:hypothetical protein